MKLRQYITVACFSLGGFLTTSCLNLEPQAQLGDNLVWNKADNFQLYANQFYSWVRDVSSAIGDNVHSDYRGDLIATNAVNVYSQGTNSVPSSDGNYTNNYKRIYYTNLLLDRANSFSDQASIATPMGEAYFFRAYLYFELVQIYGDTPLITQPLDIDSPELYGARTDRSEVVDQIISDLRQAIELLPETPSEAGRVAKDAAWAFLSRVALYEGTWQKFHTGGADATNNTERSTELLTIAREAAQQVMNRGNYSLFYNETLGDESYRYMFILEDAAQCNPANVNKSANTEYILSRRHRDGDRGTNITHGMLANVCWLTRKLANMYLCADGLPIDRSPQFQGYQTATSEFQNRDRRMTSTFLQQGQSYWNNDGAWRTTWTDADLEHCLIANVRSNSGYQNYKWCVERQVADYYESMDYPAIRYAEVLLNYAEATYELNGSITDADLDISLNLVRHRVNPDMPGLSNTLVSSNGLSMREEIRRERTVELFLEGYRIDDLKRWATAETEMPQDQVGVLFTGTWFETNWADQSRSITNDGCILLYTDRIWRDRNYLYPLPSDQLQLNPQLEQNPGWGAN